MRVKGAGEEEGREAVRVKGAGEEEGEGGSEGKRNRRGGRRGRQ